MQEVGGVWLPDGEQHLVEWMIGRGHRVGGRLTYQHHKIEAALAQVTEWNTAIDVGAHCGLWSMHLARRFGRVVAFEPVAEHRACFERNTEGLPVDLYDFALGDRMGVGRLLRTAGSSGDTRFDPATAIRAPADVASEQFDRDRDALLCRYDDLPVARTDGPVGFVKLDCEGFELYALRGMAQMLERWHPAIIVEQKPGKATAYGLEVTEAVDWLERLGYGVVREMSGDFIMRRPAP